MLRIAEPVNIVRASVALVELHRNPVSLSRQKRYSQAPSRTSIVFLRRCRRGQPGEDRRAAQAVTSPRQGEICTLCPPHLTLELELHVIFAAQIPLS